MKTFIDKLNHFSVLNHLPKVKAVIESASNDVLANQMVWATYVYFDICLGMSTPDISGMSDSDIEELSDKIILSFDHRNLEEQSTKNLAFINNHLGKVPPLGCDLAVGDVVTFTNEFGVSFHNKLVVGFDLTEPSRPVHLAGEAYWFGKPVESLEKVA